MENRTDYDVIGGWPLSTTFVLLQTVSLRKSKKKKAFFLYQQR
jgi:hypothetical protein